jgi:P27 family predicted phage terminase small subunit
LKNFKINKQKKIRAPGHLSVEARKWYRLIRSEYDIEDSGGLLILQALCEAFDRMRSAQNIIAQEGATVRDRFDQIKAHPLCTVERDSRSAIYHGLKALNLDLEPPGGN